MERFADLSRPREGIFWMVLSGLCFVTVNGTVRYLGTDLPVAQSAFLRFAFGVMILLPVLGALLRQGVPRRALALFGWRGLVHSAAVLLWFYAMARIPVAQVTAIGYLNPVLMILAGALVFGEALPLRKVIAVGVALAGAVVVLRPGVQVLTPGHYAQIVASVCFCASYLLAKRLSAMASASQVVAMMSLTVALALAPLAWWVWVPVSAAQLGWLALVACCATAGHYCMTRAFKAAPIAVTQPVTFLQLVWASLLGALVFHEAVDGFVLLGGAMIIAAISWVSWRDAAEAQRASQLGVGV
jgi:drug/metabolite transporter (DMT)-like permease